MAVAFVDVQRTSNDGNVAIVTKPTGTVENHILLAVCLGQTLSASPTITPPSGFAIIGSEYKIETARTWGLYWKRAGGSEGADYTFSIPDTADPEYISAAIVGYSGCITTGNPYDQYSSTDYVTSDMILRGGSIDPTVSTGMLVFMGASRMYFTSGGVVSGWDERLDYYSTHFLYIMDKPLTSGDATGDIDVTCGGAVEVRKHAFLLNLKEPGGVAAPVIDAVQSGSDIVVSWT